MFVSGRFNLTDLAFVEFLGYEWVKGIMIAHLRPSHPRRRVFRKDKALRTFKGSKIVIEALATTMS